MLEAIRQIQDYYITQEQTLLKTFCIWFYFCLCFCCFICFIVSMILEASWVLGVQRTKRLVGSELDMAKKIVREKDARCCKLKYKREVKIIILFCFVFGYVFVGCCCPFLF